METCNILQRIIIGSVIGVEFNIIVRMNKYQITKQTYNDVADLYEQTFMGSDLYSSSYDRFLKLIKPGSSVLEVGCGPGNVSRYLLNQKPDLKITGIDYAEQMIQRSKVNNPKVNYKVLDCKEIDTLKMKYDVAFSAFCTPYLSLNDCKKLFTAFADIIKPEGFLYLSTMEGDPLTSGYQGSSSHDGKVYIYYHQKRDLVESLESNGFEIIDSFRQAYKNKDAEATDLFIFAKLST